MSASIKHKKKLPANVNPVNISTSQFINPQENNINIIYTCCQRQLRTKTLVNLFSSSWGSGMGKRIGMATDVLRSNPLWLLCILSPLPISIKGVTRSSSSPLWLSSKWSELSVDLKSVLVPFSVHKNNERLRLFSYDNLHTLHFSIYNIVMKFVIQNCLYPRIATLISFLYQYIVQEERSSRLWCYESSYFLARKENLNQCNAYPDRRLHT